MANKDYYNNCLTWAGCAVFRCSQ